jgi:pimeloyl-ACP methyl ester carboxylesterase
MVFVLANRRGSIKQIDAGVRNVGYVDAGPANGPAVILLHGWPYDIHSYDDVMPRLTKAGQGSRLRQRLPDRQPGERQGAAAVIAVDRL